MTQILNEPQQVDTEEYLKMTVAHPHLTTAIDDLLTSIYLAEQGDLILLYGPTGVGKSTLGTRVCEKLNKEMRIELGNDPSIMPAVIVEAPHPDVVKFSWKEFYIRALAILHDPLIDKKHWDSRYSEAEKTSADLAAGHQWRRAFEGAIKNRKVRVLIIDEAQHIASGAKGGSLQGQLEYLKSLANLTKTIIILIGTYELLAFRNLSGQLSRRSIDVHFPRYHFNEVPARQTFYNIIESFFSKLPIQNDLNLSVLNEDFYLGSAGCVGILSSWLKRALKLVIKKNDPVLTMLHIEKTRISAQKMLKITEELQTGEALLKPDVHAQDKIRARLGLLSPPPIAVKDSVSENEAPVPKKTKNRRVGKRNPGRDPVGKHDVSI